MLAALNPQILAELHTLADWWKTVAAESLDPAPPAKRPRAPSRRGAKPKVSVPPTR